MWWILPGWQQLAWLKAKIEPLEWHVEVPLGNSFTTPRQGTTQRPKPLTTALVVFAIGAVGGVTIGAVALYRNLRRPARLYVCGQQTAGLNQQLASFLGWRTLVQPVKAAMPPFNRRPGMVTLARTVEFNAPVFGPAIANATMRLYDSPAMRTLAAELGVHIPHYQLSVFVQKKHVKVHDLVAAAKARPDCSSGANAAAVVKLERFLAEFGALKPADVPDLATWLAFCGRHAPAGWEQHLHFDHILPFCFGFEPVTAAALAAQQA